MIPDAERILGAYLDGHTDLIALGARVAGSTPPSHVDPWVRVVQLDALDRTGVEHLIDYLMQFDCFAGDDATRAHAAQREASDLARTVRAALKAAQGQTLESVVICDVRFTGMLRNPDTAAAEPARERWVLTASISMHA
jgi:hypothetical protein